MMMYTLLLAYLCACYSFKNQHVKNIIRAKSKLYANFQKTPISTLMEDIDKENIDVLYFSNDLKTVYSKNENEDIIMASNSEPSISNMILQQANNHHITSTIMEPQINPLTSIVNGVYGVIEFAFIPVIFIFIFRTIFGSFSNNSMNPMNPMGSSGLGPFGKMKDQKLDIIKTNISLSSWAGSPEIFQECTEIVTYLNNRTLYQDAGANIPKGILLEGPPGTGKTLIAKAIASECDANFLSVASSEFVELFVGMGAAKVRNLFQQARDNSPCIIFIDEIDAVGKQRGTGINAGNDEREQTLNQLLAEMDGFTQNENILVIAATNRRDVLDNALLRPGRFDRIVNVPLPDQNSRVDILNVHAINKTLDNSVNLTNYAILTAGYSGAQLKNLVNEAAINAVRNSSIIINKENFDDALDKLTIGIIKQNDTRSLAAQTRVAIHELGHAILAASYSQYFELKKVSIQSTYSGAGGYTIFNEYPETTESGLYTKDMLQKRIVVALGGKAAEDIFYGRKFISSGASQDLKQANNIAKQMIGSLGMGEELKTFYNENADNAQNPFLGRSLAVNAGSYSENMKNMFDKEVKYIMDESYKEALEILQTYVSKINIMTNILINAKTMDGEFIKNYICDKHIQDCYE
tara:strand:- start:1005 stop:2912 length:1908 start_codon:yes stop_codon:yes gene_type:complete